MIFYNQNDYEHIPYPSEKSPKSQLKAAGCGVCSASIVVENMTDYKLPPEECAQISLACGGRDNYGTDMLILGPVIAEKYMLKYSTTSNIEKVIEHLNAGGLCIANSGGNYLGHIGVFTGGGHYVVLVKVDGTKLYVLDPDKHDGKFDREGRAGKVEIEGDFCICDISTMVLDCANREPAYYLFSK